MYVRRNEQGEIVAISAEPLPGVDEAVRSDDSAVEDFLHKLELGAPAAMVASDLEMARVMEDVVELLVDRQIFRFTDLPRPAQQKLNQRQAMRTQSSSIDLLDDDEALDF